ncbi:MAG: DNA double-strand break repair nuclease NurA [Methanobrevibacter sp.]
MLTSLYEEAAKKKGLIQEEIQEIDNSDFDINKFWNFDYIEPSNDNKLKIAAGDGSYSSKKFLGFNIYAVAALGLIFDGDRLDNIENIELDATYHQKFLTDKLRAKMSIFEIENAIMAIEEKDVDYYMIDGSLLGDIIRPAPNDKDLQKLYIEKLDNLANILKYKDKMIAISKTSTSNDYFNNNIPDMSIFERFNKMEGYSNPKYINVNSQVKREFMIHDSFFKSLDFTIFYIRLDDYKNILKVELPYKADNDEVEEIISIIKRDSVEGYPYLLKKAHQDVIIRNSDINDLSKILGLYEKTGREMLN